METRILKMLAKTHKHENMQKHVTLNYKYNISPLCYFAFSTMNSFIYHFYG